MAHITDKLKENIPGSYYVDASCIDCDQCRATAPEFFKRQDDIGFSVVYRQPRGATEFDLAEAALQACPTESIGNDGVPKNQSSTIGGG